MPIKFQCLGGGGVVFDLTISTEPNATVTLKGEKYSKTITTDKSGTALFKNLAEGVYQATSKNSAQTSPSKEIIISKELSEFVPIPVKFSTLPVGSKLKFSGGLKGVLMRLSDGLCISEYIITRTSVSAYGSSVYRDVLDKIEMNATELKAVKVNTFKYVTSGSHNAGTDNKESRFGMLQKNTIKDKSLFPNATSKKKTYEDGRAGDYCYGAQYCDAYLDYTAYGIDENGNEAGKAVPADYGVVPEFYISADALVALGSDGYYVFV